MSRSSHQKTSRGADGEPAADAVPARELELLDSIRRIIRGHDLHSRNLLARKGVTLAQLFCLQVLLDAAACTARQLSGKVHLSASTLVGVLDRLEAKGLVERQRDDVDRRRIFLTITAAGRAVVRQSPPPLGAELRRYLAGLSPPQQASLSAALRRIADLVAPATGRTG